MINSFRRSSGWHWSLAILVVGIAAGVAVRILFPEADPPYYRQTGAAFWDEGWAHEARNGYLWGRWNQDHWRTGLVSPIYTFIVESSFRVFGISYYALRLPTIAAGLALLPLAFVQARTAKFSTPASLFGVFIIATSWAMTGFGKVAVIEPVLLLALSLTMTGVLVGERAQSAWVYALAGVSAGIALLTKMSAAPVLAAMALWLVFGEVWGSSGISIRWRLTRSLAFGLVALAVATFGFMQWIRPNYEEFVALALRHFVRDRSHGLIGVARNSIALFGSQAFLTTPLLFGTLLLFVPRLLSGSRVRSTDHHRDLFAIRFATTIIVLGVSFALLFDVFARRMIWITIPGAMLAAALWHDVFAAPAGARRNELQLMTRLGNVVSFSSCGLCALLALKWFTSPDGGALALFSPVTAARVAFTQGSLLTSALAQIATAAIIGFGLWLMLPKLWSRRRLVVVIVAVIQAAAYVALGTNWIMHRTYTVRNASIALGTLLGPPGTVVLGHAANHIAYANRTRPIFWYPGIRYANRDEQEIQTRFAPEYLLISEPEFLVRYRQAGRSFSPYVESFLSTEVARFSLFEVEASPTLSGDYVLFRRSK